MAIFNRIRKQSETVIQGPASAGIWCDLATGALQWNPDGSPRSVPQVTTAANTYFVSAVNGDDDNTGLSPAAPFQTMAAAFAVVGSGGTIYFSGKITEQLTTPVNVFDVTIVGMGNRPRHADAELGGNTYANTWKYATDNTTPNVKVIQQGWRFVNVLFQAPTAGSAVLLFRDNGAGNDERDASHAEFIGCRFAGGANGIEQSGGCGHVGVYNNFFTTLTGTAIKHTVGAGAGFPIRWDIVDNRFNSCPTIMTAVAAQDYRIKENAFSFASAPTLVFNFTSGARNTIVRNSFNIAAVDFDPAGGVTGSGATDVWSNTLTDAIETGLPAN